MAFEKIALLFETDFYEKEIFYYLHRFAEEQMDLHLLTRLWGMKSLMFTGHDYHVPMECSESFEDMSDQALAGYAAVIVPSGMVAERLRYSEDPKAIPPATRFLARCFAQERMLKGIICHGLWLCATMPQLVRGRRVTVHNNLIGDARAYGADYVDEDLVEDGDLITARTGGHCHLLARRIIDRLHNREPASGP